MARRLLSHTHQKLLGHMSSLETSYPTTGSSGDSNIPEVQEHDLKAEVMKIIEALKEENKFLKEI